MKKTILTLAVAITTTIGAFAQAPQAFNYQGIARDNVGNELTYQKISLQISILQGSDTGPAVYVETHIDTTNEFGLFNLEIGSGTVDTGNFSTINWGGNTHYLKVEMDATGGTSYQFMGTSQLLSVPYALYAGAAPGSSAQTLSLSGDTLSISSGNFVVITDNVDDADADSTNELQTLSISGSVLTISSGNTVTLPATAPSDTSLYSYNAGFADTAGYADGAAFADTAGYAGGAGYADTAAFAYSTIPDADWTIDADTLYSAADSTLTIKGGNVGIGTTSPSAKLHINADGTANQLYIQRATASQSNGLSLLDEVGNDVAQIRINGIGNNDLQIISRNNGPHNIRFYTNSDGAAGAPSNERMVISNSGNVGIGTPSPGTKLDINGALSVRGMAAPAVSPAGQGRIYFDSGTDKFKVSEGGGVYVDLVGGGGSNWTLSGTDIYNSNSGNVGIGTNSPISFTNGKALHIEATGTNVASLKLTNATNGSTLSDGFNINMGSNFGAIMMLENYPLLFGTNNTERMRIDNAGNVGIGTTSPTQLLEVENATGTAVIQIDGDATGQPQIRFAQVGLVRGYLFYDNTNGLLTLNRTGTLGAGVVVNSANNVGIGTTAPDTTLHVAGKLKLVDGTQGFGKVLTSDFTGLASWQTPAGADADWTIDADTLYSAADSTVTIKGGNVGIGTTTPGANLDVVSPNLNGIQLRDSGSGIFRASLFNVETLGGVLNLNDATGAIQAKIRGYATGGVQAYFTAGNVGIGTTSPQTLLHLQSSNTDANITQMTIEANSSSGPATYATLEFKANATSGSVGPAGRIKAFYPSPAYTTATMTFQTIDAGPVFVDAMSLRGGNVGIGTTTPLQKLHVKATSGDSEIRIEGSNTGVASTASVSFYNSTPTRIGYIGDASSGTDDIFIVADASNDIQFFTGGQNRLHITNTGNVGIGTTSPFWKFNVEWNPAINSIIPIAEFRATGPTNSAAAIRFQNTSNNFFNIGMTTNNGFAISAYNANISLAGDFFRIDSTGNVGIGDATPDGKLEVRQTGTADIFNLYDNTTNVFTVIDGGNVGIGGAASASNQVSIYPGNDNYGIYMDHNQTTSGTTWGINVNVDNTYTGSADTYGAYASAKKIGANDNSVYGCYGYALDYQTGGAFTRYAYGVIGNVWTNSTSGTSTAYGVYGSVGGNADTKYAGYFSGNVHVNGTLSKSAGTFKIDHPQDPANKYLVHSFVESPDMMNVYNGNALLDANGVAVVKLPSYFSALNKDFKYQLTPIGASMPNLYIGEKISSNQFKIAGGVPGKEVSWQVTGIRIDKYAVANRIKVEVEKLPANKGKYLHPELFGKSKEDCIHCPPVEEEVVE